MLLKSKLPWAALFSALCVVYTFQYSLATFRCVHLTIDAQPSMLIRQLPQVVLILRLKKHTAVVSQFEMCLHVKTVLTDNVCAIARSL